MATDVDIASSGGYSYKHSVEQSGSKHSIEASGSKHSNGPVEASGGSKSSNELKSDSKQQERATWSPVGSNFKPVDSTCKDKVSMLSLAKASIFGKPSGDKARSSAPVGGGMFGTVEAARNELKENLGKREYDVTDYYHETGIFRNIAASNRWQSVTLTVIMFNSLWIGIEMDLNDESCLFDARWYFQFGEYAFLVFFTFEWLCRFMAFQRILYGLRDKWFCFDTCLVILMYFETFVLLIIVKLGQSEDDESSGGAGVGQLSMLRMLRLLRLTRMVRFMRSVPELVTLLKGLSIAAKPVFSALLLLFTLMYIFAIIFRSQLNAESDSFVDRKFGNLPGAMGTLLMQGTFLDEVEKSANALRLESPLFTVVFMLFILLSAFTVLNLLIGMLCQVVTLTTETEKERGIMLYFKAKLMDVLEQIDEDKSGEISKSEFERMLKVPAAVQALDELGVDVVNLVSLADHLFEAEDIEDDRGCGSQSMDFLKTLADITSQVGDSSDMQRVESLEAELREERALEAEMREERESTQDQVPEEKTLTFGDFIETVIRLRGNNHPGVMDFVELRKLYLKGQRQLSEHMDSVENMNATLKTSLEELIVCHPLIQKLGTNPSVQMKLKKLRSTRNLGNSPSLEKRPSEWSEHDKVMEQFRARHGLKRMGRFALRRACTTDLKALELIEKGGLQHSPPQRSDKLEGGSSRDRSTSPCSLPSATPARPNVDRDGLRASASQRDEIKRVPREHTETTAASIGSSSAQVAMLERSLTEQQQWLAEDWQDHEERVPITNITSLDHSVSVEHTHGVIQNRGWMCGPAICCDSNKNSGPCCAQDSQLRQTTDVSRRIHLRI